MGIFESEANPHCRVTMFYSSDDLVNGLPWDYRELSHRMSEQRQKRTPIVNFPYPANYSSIFTIDFESDRPPFIEAEGGTEAKRFKFVARGLLHLL